MNALEIPLWLQTGLLGLWRASWQASALVVLVLALQWMFEPWLTPRWRYNLWLIVLLRLALPVTPQSPWSVFNLVPEQSKSPSAALAPAPLPAPVALSDIAQAPIVIARHATVP